MIKNENRKKIISYLLIAYSALSINALVSVLTLMKPQNLQEKLIWYYLLGTYGFYILGSLYVFSPLLAWFLTLVLGKKLWNQTEDTPEQEKISIPFSTWIWIISMIVMGVALVMGHIDWDLGEVTIFNSIVSGFSREWTLLALFPLVGCLNIRPKLIYRAICIVCLQSLIFIGICFLGNALHLPSPLYNSPFRLIGRGGTQYYNVVFGLAPGVDTAADEVRIQLFAPWAPALALVACVYFFLARAESNLKWRLIGMIGSTAMVVVSVSRLGIVCLPIVILLTWLLTNFTRPATQVTAGVVSLLTGIFSSQIINLLETSKEALSSAREGSSRVRRILGEIALYRWQESPIWGHGLSEAGPKVTEHMPIGSHHTWFALLFTKGMVGVVALAVPLLWSFIDLLVKSQKSETARVALSVLLVLIIFTSAEGIDSLAFLYWPGLVLIGIALKEVISVKKSLVSN